MLSFFILWYSNSIYVRIRILILRALDKCLVYRICVRYIQNLTKKKKPIIKPRTRLYIISGSSNRLTSLERMVCVRLNFLKNYNFLIYLIIHVLGTSITRMIFRLKLNFHLVNTHTMSARCIWWCIWHRIFFSICLS